MRWFRFLLPLISMAVLTFAAALPWGLPTAARFVLPLLPVVAIYHWTLDPDAWLPEWVIFLAGLSLDVITKGPLGYWALVYLFAYVVAVFASRIAAEGGAGRIILLALTVIVVTVFAWLAASLYFLEMLDLGPYARGAVFAIFAALLITPVLGSFRALLKPIQAIRLTRGG
jgi:rod shape-determining protein MreD